MAAETKSDAISSKHKLILAAVCITALVGLAVLVLVRSPSSCDSVFEQTAPRLEANIEIIKNKGTFAVSRERIQELSDGAQKVGLHLKTCCVVLDGGKLNSDQFQQCIDKVSTYDKQVALVAQQVTEVAVAKEQGAAAVGQEKIAAITQATAVAVSNAEALAQQVAQIKPLPAKATSPVPAGSGAEREPNDSILEASAIAPGQVVDANIVNTKDQDYFKFTHSGKLRDKIVATLENQSTTLRPWVKIYDGKKSQILDRYDSTHGANLELSFFAEAGVDYYIHVLPYDSNGKYKLSAAAKRAFDQFEPNDEALAATSLEPGQAVAANIMDTSDNDWYRLMVKEARDVTVRLENRSTTLRPHVKIYDKNKAEILDRYNGTHGADMELTFKAEAGVNYYVHVLPYNTAGDYQLIVR